MESYRDSSEKIDVRVKDLVSRMTLDEKLPSLTSKLTSVRACTPPKESTSCSTSKITLFCGSMLINLTFGRQRPFVLVCCTSGG